MNQLVSSFKFNPDYFCEGEVYTLCSDKTGKKVNALLSFVGDRSLSFYTIGDGACRDIRIGIEHLQTTEIERVIFCLIEFETADVVAVGAAPAPAEAKADTIHCGECVYMSFYKPEPDCLNPNGGILGCVSNEDFCSRGVRRKE